MMDIKVINFKCFWINIVVLLSAAITLISTEKPKIDVVAEISFCEEKVNPNVCVEDCKYKLQLSLKIVNAGQTANRNEYLKIDKAFDKKSGKDVRLYNTVVLQIREEQVSFVYPFHKIGLVNNKVYEVFVTKDNAENFIGCDEYSLPRLCGYAFVGESPETPVALKQKGFCCPCLKDAQQTGRYHLRGGQDCTNKTAGDTEKDTYHSSAHCLKFDPIWYSINELEDPHLEHTVHINAYVAETQKEQHSWLFIGDDGKEMVLSPASTYTSTNNGMIAAAYIDISSEAKQNIIDHRHKRLLIPRLNPVLMMEKIIPQQIKDGPSRYLLLDPEMIDMTGTSCNKAGVSYEAFVDQENKCTSPAQSCLDEQPMHYWLEDVENNNAGRKGKYFLSNFAKLPSNPILMNTETGEENLVVMVTQPHQIILYFEINADGLMPLHEGIAAKITEVYVAPNGTYQQQVYVDVFNAGLVAAVFHISLVKCKNTTALEEEEEVNAMTIAPHASYQYVMTVTGNKPGKMTGSASCVVEILNEVDGVVAARAVQFRHGEKCICEAFCHCECQSSALVCRPLSQEEYHVAGFRGTVPQLRPHPPHVEFQVALVFVCIIFLLLLLGLCKGLLGIVTPAVGNLGLFLFTSNKRLPRYYEKELWGMTVVYNNEGLPVHPVSGQAVRRRGLGLEFFLNTVFFFYVPFMGIHYCISKISQRHRNQNRTDYQPKKYHPELPSVDEESQEEEEVPIYENVFTLSKMNAKVETKTSQDSQIHIYDNVGLVPNHEELFSQDSDEDTEDSQKKRRWRRKRSDNSTRRHSKTSQKRKDSSQEGKQDQGIDELTDGIKIGSADSSKTASRSSSKSKEGKQDQGIDELTDGINIESAHSSKTSSRSSSKSKERKRDRNIDKTDVDRTGSAHKRTSKSLSRSSSKSKGRKREQDIQDLDIPNESGHESSRQDWDKPNESDQSFRRDSGQSFRPDLDIINESGQSSRQPSLIDDFDVYPGSARKYSVPLSQRNLGMPFGSKIGALIFGKSGSSAGSLGKNSVQGSVQSAETTSPNNPRQSRIGSLLFRKSGSSAGGSGQNVVQLDPIQSAESTSPSISRTRISKRSIISNKSTSAYDEVLKLAKSGKRVYYNFNKADDRITGTGNVYSMCGCLQTQGGAFVFDLDIHNVQVYSNQDGIRQELDEPIELNSHDFRRVMSAEECLQVITLYPMHPCLNKVIINQSDSGGSIENQSSHSMFYSDH